jgi:tRNA(Ile)-lysidine synthase
VRQRIGRGVAKGFVGSVAASIARRRLLGRDDAVLVATSAGADSTALLAALATLRDAGRVREIFALHVDHGLRGGGEADAACAREACERLSVPFESVRVRVGSGNVQAAARRARYAALRAAAARLGATRIATGHTLSDQAETFLLRALRGAGARGLASIPPRRGAIVRPLIDVSREEVIGFLRQEGLRWREDPSNASTRFARNVLRLRLVPVLREIEPRFERAFARAADLLRDDERALALRAKGHLRDGAPLSIPAVMAEPRAVRRRAIRALWRRESGGARALPAAQVDALLALCRRGRPGRLSLPRGIEARAAYGRLAIGPRNPGVAPRAPVPVDGPGKYRLGNVLVQVELEPGASSDAVPWPLVLRGRLPGDRIRPERSRGGKKLKDWLIDRKVPREQRDLLVVLADEEGNVLSLPELGIRSSRAGSLRVTVRSRPEA